MITGDIPATFTPSCTRHTNNGHTPHYGHAALEVLRGLNSALSTSAWESTLVIYRGDYLRILLIFLPRLQEALQPVYLLLRDTSGQTDGSQNVGFTYIFN